MKTNNKISAYILRGSTTALLFSCVLVALCLATHVPEQPTKARPPQDNVGFGANAHQDRSLSFADRVAYQRAIEEVYWRHRIWPKENPNPKPPLDAVMSQAQLEKKVTEYLCNSQALEDYWQAPITADQLQTEMERMAQHTKQPDVLRELFAALSNDPFAIAECLAKPVLTQRFVADLSGQDETMHFEAARPKSVHSMSMAATFSNVAYTLPAIFEGDPPCTDDTWTTTNTINAPADRELHTALWTGSEMVVWGGSFPYLNTGGRYNPSTDSWTATSTTNSPSARDSHTAVWTGSEMVVWGGFDGNSFLNTGGRYNPITDSWIPTSIANAPSARLSHTAVWTGSEMIVWGGDNGGPLLNTGGRYNPIIDSWTATSAASAPAGREKHTAVWTGSQMIVWGGEGDSGNRLNTGGRYNPSTDSWTTTTTTAAPVAREFPTAVWTGTEMIVWGGYGGVSGDLNSGGRYNPSTNSWTSTSTTGAPTGREHHTAI